MKNEDVTPVRMTPVRTRQNMLVACLCIVFAASGCGVGGLLGGRHRAAARSGGFDHRIWQHGLDILQVGDRRLAVWSSWGNPPVATVADDEKEWQHDVYYSWLDPLSPRIEPHFLAGGPEAQEPASTAINCRGRILMTCEDARNGANLEQQSAGLWDSDLRPIAPFPMLVQSSAHSGHAAAMQDKFLIAYGVGWIEEGGVDRLGTGHDVWARTVTNEGVMGEAIPVAVSPSRSQRDWWPLVAGSDSNWLVLWQRYDGNDHDPGGTLWGAIVSSSGIVGERFSIMPALKLYHYNVTYLPTLGMYAVIGSQKNGSGFLSLVTKEGRVARSCTGLPMTVRESKLVVAPSATPGAVTAAYPVSGGGVAVLEISGNAILFKKRVPALANWDYLGTDGFFLDADRVLFATLSEQGVRLVVVRLSETP